MNQELHVCADSSPVRYAFRLTTIYLAISVLVGTLMQSIFSSVFTVLVFSLILYFHTSQKYISSHKISDAGFLVKLIIWYIIIWFTLNSVAILVFFAMLKMVFLATSTNPVLGVLLIPFAAVYKTFSSTQSLTIGLSLIWLTLQSCVIYYITKRKLAEYIPPTISGEAYSQTVLQEFSFSSLRAVLAESRGKLFFIFLASIVALALALRIAVPFIQTTFYSISPKAERVELEKRIADASTITELTVGGMGTDAGDFKVLQAISTLSSPVLKKLYIRGDGVNKIPALPSEVFQIKSIEELGFNLWVDDTSIEGGIYQVKIPVEVTRLTNLRSLNIYVVARDGEKARNNGKKIGPVILEVPDLSSLQSLDQFSIGSNNGLVLETKKLVFNGVLPESLENLSIGSLGLEKGALLDGPRFGGMLKHLSIWNNPNLGEFPQWVFRQFALTDLTLKNLGANILPDDIAKIQSLENLNIEQNNIAILPDEILKLSHLQFLQISNNPLTSFPVDMKNLKNLTRVNAVYTCLPYNAGHELPSSLRIYLPYVTAFFHSRSDQCTNEILLEMSSNFLMEH